MAYLSIHRPILLSRLRRKHHRQVRRSRSLGSEREGAGRSQGACALQKLKLWWKEKTQADTYLGTEALAILRLSESGDKAPCCIFAQRIIVDFNAWHLSQPATCKAKFTARSNDHWLDG